MSIQDRAKCVDCGTVMSVTGDTIVPLCWKCQMIREISAMKITINIVVDGKTKTQIIQIGAVFDVTERKDV
jgi:hypothetical protein